MEKQGMTEKQVVDKIRAINKILNSKEADIPAGTRYHIIARYKTGAQMIKTTDGKKFLLDALTLYRIKNEKELKRLLQLNNERIFYHRQLETGSWAGGDLTNPNG